MSADNQSATPTRDKTHPWGKAPSPPVLTGGEGWGEGGVAAADQYPPIKRAVPTLNNQAKTPRSTPVRPLTPAPTQSPSPANQAHPPKPTNQEYSTQRPKAAKNAPPTPTRSEPLIRSANQANTSANRLENRQKKSPTSAAGQTSQRLLIGCNERLHRV